MIDTNSFDQIKKDLSNCVNIKHKSYYYNELITRYSNNKKQIFYINHGNALIMKHDKDGNTIMLRDLKENDIFSNLFYQGIDDDIYVTSNSTIAEISIIDYSAIIKDCSKECPYHNRFVLSLFELLIEDNRQLNIKIELLSNKRVRDRIIFFLKQRAKNNIFKVTTSYKAIAEYINVDRSNLMRQLNNMENEGLLKKEGRTIYLLNI